MGILESHLPAISKGLTGVEAADPQRVLCQLWLSSQIGYPTTQWTGARAACQASPPTEYPLRAATHLSAQRHLGSSWLPMVRTAESPAAALAAPGQQTVSSHCAVGTATARYQSQNHRLSPQSPKALAAENPLRPDQAGNSAETSHPTEDRLLGCSPARIHRSRPGGSLRQLGLGRVLPFSEPDRHPHHLGGNPRCDG